MKHYILINIAFAVVIIGGFSMIMRLMWGWRGMAAYLLFSAVCMTPAVLRARKILYRKKGGPA